MTWGQLPMLFSQISCILRRTHRWNFSKGNLGKAWNCHDAAFPQHIQLPRVQVSRHYNHETFRQLPMRSYSHWCVLSHHHIVPITSRNSFCQAFLHVLLSPQGLRRLGPMCFWFRVTFPGRKWYWKNITALSQIPGKLHISGAPIRDFYHN